MNKAALDALFWRDEILQVLFWMRGEELAEAVTVRDLLSFLQGDEATVAFHLEKLAAEGYLLRYAPADGRALPSYALTERGRHEGGRRFADAFEGMRKQGHGECGPECICNWEGAAACPAHQHDHHHHS